jgi:hypothetical protein
MRIKYVLAIVGMAALLAACAPKMPVEQVQSLRDTFVNVETASQPLLDDLAAAERKLGKNQAVSDAQFNDGTERPEPLVLAPAGDGDRPAIEVRRCYEGSPGWQRTGTTTGDGEQRGFIDGFCLEDAAYFATVGDPPATRVFRRSVDTLNRYSQVLLVLAKGENIEEAKAHLKAAGSSIASTLALVPGAQGPAAMISPVLEALGPVFEEAAKAQNFEEMTRLVAEATPKFNRLVAAIKAASPWLFETLIRTQSAKAPLQTEGNPELARSVVNQIEGYRVAVSNFVILLDEMARVHTEMAETLAEAEQAPLSLAALAGNAERLNVQAEALREAFVTIRRGSEI